MSVEKETEQADTAGQGEGVEREQELQCGAGQQTELVQAVTGYRPCGTDCRY